MKRLLSILFVFASISLFSQNNILLSGQGWLNNNSSTITEVTNYGLLNEKNKFNSYGIALSAGCRFGNGFGFELGGGLVSQKWNFDDGTLSYFTNGLETNTFSNKMRMAQFQAGFHKVIQKENQNFIYLKTAFEINFIQTGTYWNDDPSGIGPQRIYNGYYNNSMSFLFNPEVGLFLKSTRREEISVFSAYKVGLTSPYQLNYQLSGNDFAEYNIDGQGNRFTLGIKYTYKIPLSNEPKEKKVKTPKEPKEKKEKKPKEPINKELKTDSKGIPKKLKDREVEKEKTIYVESTNLVFKVWDSGAEVDGDTISLNLNGEWLIENFGLTRDKHGVKVTINPDGKNFLMLFAHNLGKWAPNTAAVSVWDGKTEQVLELRSDLEKCGALNIVYRPKK